MIAGFDYGSSNCSIGVITENKLRLIPLEKDRAYLPSALYAVDRELICENVANNIADSQLLNSYIQERSNALSRARNVRRELHIQPKEQTVLVGEEAIVNYIAVPEEGFFVKSPKSFLGASGLSQGQMGFFEDVVTSMMLWVKQNAERKVQTQITDAVIGRPINFQGAGGDRGNQQAVKILSDAALKAGFRNIELLYEPLAAGIDFETNLDKNQTVLVVDIGGGTTDCSIVKMGPSHVNKPDRTSDFLGHAGERIGGNDIDIHLSYEKLTPLFGQGSLLKSGLTVPNRHYWNAVEINNVWAQAEFSSRQTAEAIHILCNDAAQPELLQRLLHMQAHKQHYQLLRSGETCKIALSDNDEHEVKLDYIEHRLSTRIDRQQFENAVRRPLKAIEKLIHEVSVQAQCTPDIVYVTGGTAKSPTIRRHINKALGDISIVDGDMFGSVTAGLTKWAEKIYA